VIRSSNRPNRPGRQPTPRFRTLANVEGRWYKNVQGARLRI